MGYFIPQIVEIALIGIFEYFEILFHESIETVVI